jgi:hypothetical protein
MSKFLIPGAGIVAMFAANKAGYLDKVFDEAKRRLDEYSGKSSGFDLELKNMYSFDKNTTHCPDREMIHPCTTELAAFIAENSTDADADRAYQCTETVYSLMGNDYNIVKNMTHLLLDLDVNEHIFNKDRNARFHLLGERFAKKLMFNDECLAEFDSKSELECRCPLLYGKILLLKLKNAGRWSEAEELFKELKAYEWDGEKKYPAGRAFPWKNIQQTPQTYIEGLEGNVVWPEKRRKDLPIWDTLEDNFPMIRDEVAALYTHGKRYDPAYRFLFKQGQWDQVLLYSGREWKEENCELMPKTCELLKKELPKRRVHHYPWMSSQNEQVLVLRVSPGTDMEAHCGPSNSVLNIHMGISGVDGAVLQIANGTYGWEEGKVIPWDGSFDHAVNCFNCKQDRVIVMVRYMHPDMVKEHYIGQGNTTAFEPIPSQEVLAEFDHLD